MAKRKQWHYVNASTNHVGLMRCHTCGFKIEKGPWGDFRYRDDGDKYVIQCRQCCPEPWVPIDEQQKAALSHNEGMKKLCLDFYRKTGITDLYDYVTHDEIDAIDKEWSL